MPSPTDRVLRVGCPMWAHRPWVGRYYPTGTKPGAELALYSYWCNAVEGNTTFYAQPPPTTVERWLEHTHDDFRFAFKLPRTVTHEKRLHDVAVEARSFLDAITPLSRRLGPIQVQLPQSFGPESLDVLTAFVHRLPREFAWAIELRHRSFFDGSAAHREVDELCLAHDVGRVILDSRPLYATEPLSDAALDERRTKPRLPVVTDVAGAQPIVRLIGEDSAAGTLDGLRAWVAPVSDWIAAGREPFVFVHQPENLDSPGLARTFHEAVAEVTNGLRPLRDPPGQMSML